MLLPSSSRTQARCLILNTNIDLPVGSTAVLKFEALAPVPPQGQLDLWAWAVSHMVP